VVTKTKKGMERWENTEQRPIPADYI